MIARHLAQATSHKGAEGNRMPYAEVPSYGSWVSARKGNQIRDETRRLAILPGLCEG
jgi:2-keto-3-deoxy-galactonokinase